jgi:hypothetical protein
MTVPPGRFPDRFHLGAYIPQATCSLQIADVAGTLSGLNAGPNRLDDGAVAGGDEFCTDTFRRIAKAVAHEYIVAAGFSS